MRFAGRVSAANYITAGANAAKQSSDMAMTARENAPNYTEQVTQSIKEQAQNYDNAVKNSAEIANAGTAAQGRVAITKADIEVQKARADAKRGVAKGQMLAKAGGLLAAGLQKPIERKFRETSTEGIDKQLTLLQGQRDSLLQEAEDLRNTPIETPTDTSSSSSTPTQSDGGNTSTNLPAAGKPGDVGIALMDSLIKDGYSPVQAAAIAGNAQYESANFTAHEEFVKNSYGTKGAGYLQWTNAGGSNRRDNFENWSRAQGLDPRSHAANTGFLKHEIKGGAGQHWTGGMDDASFRQIGDLNSAVTAFQNNYLRPNPAVANTPQRLSNAQALLSAYNNR